MSYSSGKDTGGLTEPAALERRQHLRFPFTASVEVTEAKSGARIVGRASDLGLGGCYVDAINPFPTGTDTAIRITRGNESFEAQAKVIYSQIGMGMGLAFTSAKQRQVRLFQRWLTEIGGTSVTGVPVEEHPEVASSSLAEERNSVLAQLLTILIRKNVLTEVEGKAMLKKLL